MPNVNHKREARVATTAAVVACAITFVIVGLFDPFGFQRDRVDDRIRVAEAITLCAVRATWINRIEQINEEPVPDDPALADSLYDARDTLTRGVKALNRGQTILGVRCPVPAFSGTLPNVIDTETGGTE